MHAKPTKSQTSALIAVSGGLDSIVLLDLLSKQLNNKLDKSDSLSDLIKDFVQQNNLAKLELAYINHSQRPDTDQDIQAIQKANVEANLNLHVRKVDLKPRTSESQARILRYQELGKILKERNLDHLITAHHADDVLETAIINLTRGTGPKGLSALRHHPEETWRPYLLNFDQKIFVTKQDLLDYAEQNNLTWHEDSTNQSSQYFRNRVRSKLSSAPNQHKQAFLEILSKNQASTLASNLLTTELLEGLKKDRNNTFDKPAFMRLPLELRAHLIHHRLSLIGYDVNRQAVQKALSFIESAGTGKVLQLKGADLKIESKQTFSLLPARQSTKKKQ